MSGFRRSHAGANFPAANAAKWKKPSLTKDTQAAPKLRAATSGHADGACQSDGPRAATSHGQQEAGGDGSHLEAAATKGPRQVDATEAADGNLPKAQEHDSRTKAAAAASGDLGSKSVADDAPMAPTEQAARRRQPRELQDLMPFAWDK